MKIWGIGAYWDGADDMSEFFVNNSLAAIGWPEEYAPSIHAMANEMEIGDLIYIKSFSIGAKVLNIKAVGKIVGYPYVDTSLFGGEIKKAVPVKWLYTGDNVKYPLSQAETRNNVYSLTLYREYSPGVIRTLNKLVDF